MRVIAKRANVTTGSLYARYSNKNALFGALVDPVITEFLKANDKGNDESEQKLYAGQVDEIWAGAETSATGIIELIYANKTAFSLLINCANGSSYEHFIDELSAHEEKKAMEFLQVLQNRGYPCLPVSEQVVHMLISAHCYALFETVRHDLSKEDALQQANQINDFFAQGWNKIYGL